MLRQSERGYTLLNVVGALALTALLAGTAVGSFKELSDPLANASFASEHFLRLARSQAISNTQAIQVSPISSSRIGAYSSGSCTGTMTAVDNLFVDLPAGAALTDTSWSVCFTQRGLANSNVSFTIQDSDGLARTVSIALGGGTKVSRTSL